MKLEVAYSGGGGSKKKVLVVRVKGDRGGCSIESEAMMVIKRRLRKKDD